MAVMSEWRRGEWSAVVVEGKIANQLNDGDIARSLSRLLPITSPITLSVLFLTDWLSTVCDILDQLSDKPVRECNFFKYIHITLLF
jgi:hypothetical protein